MKANDHNKILGILHLAYGGFTVVLMAVLSIFMIGMMAAIGANDTRGEALPVGLFAALIAFICVMNLILTVPSLLTGYGLLKQKRWAKTAGIIAGIVAGLSFPLGSALCVYTMWFLFGENGKIVYHKRVYELSPGGRHWHGASRRLPQPEYVPPATPPDWR